MTNRNREEDKLQSECFKWFWNTYPQHRRMLFHVDNNSWNAIIGALKKALGVVRGPSDLIFVDYGSVYFIEMKTPTGKQSEEQIDFMNKVRERGHVYLVLRTVEQFKSFIINNLHIQ